MVSLARLIPVLLAVLTGGMSARAQTAPALPTDPLLGAPAHPRAAESDPILDRTPTLIESVAPRREDWRAAVDIGLPTGVRVQRQLFDTNLWIEGGAGVWWIVPYVSACLRHDGTLYRGQRNLFAIRPGISATLILVDPNLGVGIDSEFIWQHTFNGRVTTELGFRLGITAVFSRDHGYLPNPFPVPVGTLMFAVAF